MTVNCERSRVNDLTEIIDFWSFPIYGEVAPDAKINWKRSIAKQL
ncbi:MAG: hypothetical protein RMY62_009370 [Nostoc sp. ZfuVER08]|nr:hypothetical protein [Nostoc punctiforme]MDZ8012535.1 hypothetical protein [Nostoc sp. ZfuVER08]